MSFYILMSSQFNILLTLAQVQLIQTEHDQNGPNPENHLPKTIRTTHQIRETHSEITHNLDELNLTPPCLLIMVGEKSHVVPIIEHKDPYPLALYSAKVHQNEAGFVYFRAPEGLRSFIAQCTPGLTLFQTVLLNRA